MCFAFVCVDVANVESLFVAERCICIKYVIDFTTEHLVLIVHFKIQLC